MSVKIVQVIIDDATTTLSYNSDTKMYEGEVVAPDKSSYPKTGHYYNVTVKATSTSGDTTTKDSSDTELGENLRLYVKEQVAPVQKITYPTDQSFISENDVTFIWSVSDDDSGVNSNTISFNLDGTKYTGSAISKIKTEDGYTCSYGATSMEDGEHYFIIDVSDYDGNAATPQYATFAIDKYYPSLTVTEPQDGIITKTTTITVSGTTLDIALKKRITLTIQVNDNTPVTVAVNDDGSFSEDVAVERGVNTITIVAKDTRGKTTTVTRKITIDTTPPVIKWATVVPNPVDAGKTQVITTEVVDED